MGRRRGRAHGTTPVAHVQAGERSGHPRITRHAITRFDARPLRLGPRGEVDVREPSDRVTRDPVDVPDRLFAAAPPPPAPAPAGWRGMFMCAARRRPSGSRLGRPARGAGRVEPHQCIGHPEEENPERLRHRRRRVAVECHVDPVGDVQAVPLDVLDRVPEVGEQVLARHEQRVAQVGVVLEGRANGPGSRGTTRASVRLTATCSTRPLSARAAAPRGRPEAAVPQLRHELVGDVPRQQQRESGWSSNNCARRRPGSSVPACTCRSCTSPHLDDASTNHRRVRRS